MTFGYDICTYLLNNHSEWDETVVSGGFKLNIDALNRIPGDLSATESQEIIWLNQVPETLTDCICVYDTGGYSPEHSYCSDCIIDRPTAQIRVRNKSLQVAEQTAYAIYILLDEVNFEEINTRYYSKISCNQPPTYLSEDQITTNATAYEFTLNLNSIMKRK